jgi:hypothetical protein
MHLATLSISGTFLGWVGGKVLMHVISIIIFAITFTVIMIVVILLNVLLQEYTPAPK